MGKWLLARIHARITACRLCSDHGLHSVLCLSPVLFYHLLTRIFYEFRNTLYYNTSIKFLFEINKENVKIFIRSLMSRMISFRVALNLGLVI